MSLHAQPGSMWHNPIVMASITHDAAHPALQNALETLNLNYEVENNLAGFSPELGEWGKSHLHSFCCHIGPRKTTFWMLWLKHVVERGMEQDPGLQSELTNESRRVRTKLLE